MTTLKNRPNTALLVIDVQNGVVGGAHERDAVVANVGSLVDKARRERIAVVWVQHSDEQLGRGSDDWRIVPELTPGDAEPLVEKNYGDSFEDTTLEAVLSRLSIGRLVVAGAETGDGRWDAVGSLAIGVVLVGVALFLANEIRSLLVGEAADPITERAVRAVAEADPNIVEVIRMLTIQQGPGEVVVAMKLRWKDGLQTGGELERATNALEDRIAERCPEVKWTFMEPDLDD